MTERILDLNVMENFANKIHKLPDMERFCGNVREDYVESQSAQYKIRKDELESN